MSSIGIESVIMPVVTRSLCLCRNPKYAFIVMRVLRESSRSISFSPDTELASVIGDTISTCSAYSELDACEDIIRGFLKDCYFRSYTHGFDGMIDWLFR